MNPDQEQKLRQDKSCHTFCNPVKPSPFPSVASTLKVLAGHVSGLYLRGPRLSSLLSFNTRFPVRASLTAAHIPRLFPFIRVLFFILGPDRPTTHPEKDLGNPISIKTSSPGPAHFSSRVFPLSPPNDLQ